MKKINLLTLLLLTSIAFFQCKPDHSTQAEGSNNSFGAGVPNQDNPLPFADLVSILDTQDSVRAVVKAKVTEVCQMKGCWMNLQDNMNATDETLFVKFKDYAFFVPKDIAGREVLIEGVAYKEETPVDELKHYAEDAGQSAEEIAAITSPKVEKKFMATGVVLIDKEASGTN